jgi:hypothetical protein
MIQSFSWRSANITEWSSPTCHLTSRNIHLGDELSTETSNIPRSAHVINQASAGLFKRPPQIKRAQHTEDGQLIQTGVFVNQPENRRSIRSQLTNQIPVEKRPRKLAERPTRRSLRSSEPSGVIEPEVYKYSKVHGLGKPWKAYVTLLRRLTIAALIILQTPCISNNRKRSGDC